MSFPAFALLRSMEGGVDAVEEPRLLAVGCVVAVFAVVVAVEEGLRDGVCLRAEGEGAVGHAGDSFEDYGVVDGVFGGASPGEGGVTGDEAGGDGERIDGEGVLAGGAGIGAHVAAGIRDVVGGGGGRGGLEGAAGTGAEEAHDGEAGFMNVAPLDSEVGEG